MNKEEIIRVAKEEIKNEEFLMAVGKMKVKLRNKRSIWARVCPYKIILIRRL